jgi:thiopeptide-type bacteriocin biosynthesis protein
VGRNVLALAQWRITAAGAAELSGDRPDIFPQALERWRGRLNVPRHVYLASGDNRLLLDLSDTRQAEELRQALLKLPGDRSIVLKEVLPSVHYTWLRDSANRPFMAELAVPLIRRHDGTEQPQAGQRRGAGQPLMDAASPDLKGPPPDPGISHLHPPGSEWLFLKLYVPRDLEEDVIVGPLRALANEVLGSEMVTSLFFLRFNDPERHLRLRFHGDAGRLLSELLPVVCEWAARLVQEGLCHRFAFDTYERETERFGGRDAIAIAEDLFAADCRAVADLLHALQTQQVEFDRIALAVLTTDTLLGGMGLDARARVSWCHTQLRARQETSPEYRRRKNALRALLAAADLAEHARGSSLVFDTLADLRTSLTGLHQRYAALEADGQLRRPLRDLYWSFVHLHLNRLLGGGGSQERLVIELLWRTREGLLRAPVSRSAAR